MAVTAAVEFVLEAFVGVDGSFGAESDFAALETAADALSFFSSASEDNSKELIHFPYNGAA